MEPTNVWTYATNKRIVFGSVSGRQPISEALKDLGLTRIEALQLIEFGSVYWNAKRLAADLCPLSQARLRVHLKPRRFEVARHPWPALIVESLESYVVVHKPAGIPVHASLDNRWENVLSQIESLIGRRLYPIHRLDVDTEGLLVFAKSAEAAALGQRWLTERKIKRIYEAHVCKVVAVGVHTHYMQPSPRAPKSVSLHPPGSLCQMKILGCEQAGPYFRVAIELVTGRTHQIRVQLAALGAPIVGDTLYGGETHSRLRLCASDLEIKPLKRFYSLRNAEGGAQAKILDNPRGE